ncbi:MAG: sugar nucleotide-binding protein [Propionibacterium sp.]|nr:sugar nucleotide-binding protein [Propionibacterium sp.]
MAEPTVHTTEIPGLLVIRLGVQHNDDGWFKEGWHRAKMTALGLPDFDPVQYNVTHVVARGITRGFLAEPWDRIVGMNHGRALGAWVDLREGAGFGRTFTIDLNPSVAVFVPRGVATGHQVLEDDSTFTYLMEQHWTPEGRGRASTVDLFDPALGIEWPIGREHAIVAHRDTLNPPLAHAEPMRPRRTLVAGTETRLGRAMLGAFPGADGVTTAELAPRAATPVDLSAYDVLINAHGDTATGIPQPPARTDDWVDASERANRLADVARRHHMRYVHISADPVFERSAPAHDEYGVLSLSDTHGQGLAAGELIAATVPRSLVIRTGWVMGREGSFVEAMAVAARRGESPRVISDRYGRLTFADQLATGITHLLDRGASSGTYNITGDGQVVSWVDIARRVFEMSGADPRLVLGVRAPADGPPDAAVLELELVKSTGYRPGNSWLMLADRLPHPAERPRPFVVEAPPATLEDGGGDDDGRKPFKVLFVCTANICRSAYADVVANAATPDGIEFASAGTRALVGHAIDPPMAEEIERGDHGAHRARQLTRTMIEEADLVLAMASDHRRWILDEWPNLGRKAYVIGYVARAMASVPREVTLDTLVDHLWRHRSADPRDDVADPYRRGPVAMKTAADQIDGAMDVITRGLTELAARAR